MCQLSLRKLRLNRLTSFPTDTPSMNKFQATLRQFEKALKSFKGVLSLQKSDVVRDAAIKRFELTLDLSWKMLKVFLEDKMGLLCASPKECFREAYRQGIIKYDEAWLTLVDLRNETVHTYNEKTAKRIFSQLPDAARQFESLVDAVKKKLKE